jgi:hypothetical protein
MGAHLTEAELFSTVVFERLSRFGVLDLHRRRRCVKTLHAVSNACPPLFDTPLNSDAVPRSIVKIRKITFTTLHCFAKELKQA